MSETKAERRKRSKREWLDHNMESLNVSLKQGTKDAWKGYAAKSDMPLVKFIEAAVEEKAQRDNLK